MRSEVERRGGGQATHAPLPRPRSPQCRRRPRDRRTRSKTPTLLMAPQRASARHTPPRSAARKQPAPRGRTPCVAPESVTRGTGWGTEATHSSGGKSETRCRTPVGGRTAPTPGIAREHLHLGCRRAARGWGRGVLQLPLHTARKPALVSFRCGGRGGCCCSRTAPTTATTPHTMLPTRPRRNAGVELGIPDTQTDMLPGNRERCMRSRIR